jgi:hypothetical protein
MTTILLLLYPVDTIQNICFLFSPTEPSES